MSTSTAIQQIETVANRMYATQIPSLEVIAQRIRAPTVDDYVRKYAKAIAREKLQNSRYSFTEQNSEFPFYIDLNETTRILVGVAPTYITLNGSRPNAKSDLLKYVKRIEQEMAQHSGPIPVENNLANQTKQEPIIRDCIGIIQFLPTPMNGRDAKQILNHELHSRIGYVNVTYTEDNLKRRYRDYGSGQARRY